MDWDDARAFVAIYRQGTLRGAASELRVDQATVGRRLASLEKALGAKLFLRTPKGYVPTPAGELAHRAAQQMEDGAHELQRRLQGLDERPQGMVSLACTDTVATVFLLPGLRRLQERHPGISVKLQVSTSLTNLTRREADLAVRPVRPKDSDLIVRHLGRCATALYASQDYLARRGMPRPGTGLAGHDIVIYPKEIVPYQQEALCGEPLGAARVAIEASAGMMLAQAVALGLGIGEVPVHLARLFPTLRRIWPDRQEPYDMWLVTHGDLQRTARVRAVAEMVVEAFRGNDSVS